jgi:hypothetical protein
MEKLEESQLKAVFKELTGHIASGITKQSFREALTLYNVQIFNGITPASSQFPLYCAELYGMLLGQCEHYLLSASKSTTHSSKDTHLHSSQEELKVKSNDYYMEVHGARAEEVISETMFR